MVNVEEARMAELVARPVELKHIYTLPAEKAMALEDPLRALLLNLLSERPMSVEEMAAEARKRGHRKAVTTLRHHVEVLKRAGLIELARVREARGAALKYYAATARVLGYELTPEAENALRSAIEDAEKRVEKTVRELLRTHRRELREAAEGLKDCPYCPTPHFVEYAALKVLERATARAAKKIDWARV